MVERSLDITEVLRGVEGGDETGSRLAHFLEKGSRKFISSVC